MIYFLQAEKGDKHIKIGFTDVYTHRSKTLNKQHGTLNLLGVMDGDKAIERQLHAQFKALRINRHEEWFRVAPELLDFIAKNTTLDAPEIKTMKIMVSENAAEMLKKLKSRFDVGTTLQVLDLVLQDYDKNIWDRVVSIVDISREYRNEGKRQRKQSSE